MRRDKSAVKRSGVLLGVLLLVVSLSLLSCAEKTPPPKVKRPKQPAVAPQTKIQDTRPEETQLVPSKPRIGESELATPARRASNALVEKGKALMSAGENELGSGRFKGAIQLDPSNGQAYYYLALSYSKTGQSDLAHGALDKASNLLRHDPEWSEKIDELRQDLEDEGY